MANKSVFASIVGKLLPRTDVQNREGAPAHAYEPRHALAQLAVTGTLDRTFYAEAREQLDTVLRLACEVDPAFVAKTAIWSREHGHMKDMPALLLAHLSMLQTEHFTRAFPRVVTGAKMLRTFVQIMRSGQTGRKSLGTRPKKLVQAWLEQASVDTILAAAVGNDPSLADVIRMVHPRPASAERRALWAWAIGKPHDVLALPEIVRRYEAFKRDPSGEVPAVPFQLLTSLPLSGAQWVEIGRKAGWHMLRMNLNTFVRHGAFEVEGFAEHVAARLADATAIEKAKVFPYQLMAAHAAAGPAVPAIVRAALQDAMEIAVSNVPKIDGRVVICPDVSGSMTSPVTGYRKGSTTVVRCIDVAGLVAAAFLRADHRTRVIPFEGAVVAVDLNPRDSIATNAAKLAAIGGGGTNCSAPIEQLVAERAKVDLVVFVSDNQSWVDARAGRGTALAAAWAKLKRRNPSARLVAIDIQPYGTTQAAEDTDILNVGGFSDAVFDIIGRFAAGELSAEHWVGEIEKVSLD